MLKRLLAALLLIPLADALFLVYVASQFSWQFTVALVVLTALLGMVFVRAEGRRTLRTLESKLQAGEVPSNQLLDGAMLIAAGAFLLTPGLITDAIGFLLVLPPTRYAIREVAKRWVVTPYLDKRTGGFATGNVYTFGFPNPSESGGGSSRTVYDVDAEFTDIDIEDDDDEQRESSE